MSNKKKFIANDIKYHSKRYGFFINKQKYHEDLHLKGFKGQKELQGKAWSAKYWHLEALREFEKGYADLDKFDFKKARKCKFKAREKEFSYEKCVEGGSSG